ncbi:MAG: hypothetical protein ACLRUZ_10130 [Faecalimonas sp.]
MVKYTIRRFVEMLFTLFVIATGTFFLLAAVPGDASLQEQINCRKKSVSTFTSDMVLTNHFLSVMESQ